jgi:hypothetical protein
MNLLSARQRTADSIHGQQKLQVLEQPEAQVAHQRYCHQSQSLNHGQRSVSFNVQWLQLVKGHYVSYPVHDVAAQ